LVYKVYGIVYRIVKYTVYLRANTIDIPSDNIDFEFIDESDDFLLTDKKKIIIANLKELLLSFWKKLMMTIIIMYLVLISVENAWVD
jgi:hypothetical protein